MSSYATIQLPQRKRGPRSEETKEQISQFVSDLKQLNKGLEFKPSARGWGYILENEGAINKSELDDAERWINECRDEGRLPLDFVSKDDSRKFSCVEEVNFTSPERYLNTYFDAILRGYGYDVSFWDSQDYYIQVLVEKVDLRELFEPICNKYKIPIANAKGWPSKNQRGEMIARWYAWQQKGLKPVLLYCGDLDPAGRSISDNYRRMLNHPEWKIPVNADWVNKDYISGWTPDDAGLEIDRFGLQKHQVEEAGLTWIDNLETGGSNQPPFNDPSHNDHEQSYVQNYINDIGVRKVEANALVTNPEYGRQIFQKVLDFYLGENPLKDYEEELEQQKNEIQNILRKEGLRQQMIDYQMK